MIKTTFTELTQVQWPIIQAPMIGYSSPEMVATVSNLGALGTLAAGNLTSEEIKQQCEQISSLTKQPFAVNLFVGHRQDIPQFDSNSVIIKTLLPYYKELGIHESILQQQSMTKLPDLNEQVEALLTTNVLIVTFTFGLPNSALVKKLKSNGITVMATATSIEEVQMIEEAEFNAVIVQGIEAGGHRASFLTDGSTGPEAQSLVKQVHQNISIPIIVAGGIMTGQQITHHLKSGADACQLGTAFLFTNEAAVELHYLDALLKKNIETCLSNSFTGKFARVIRNKYTNEMNHQTVAPFPYQGQLTAQLRDKASEMHRVEYLPFWAGLSVSLGRQKTTKELTKTLIEELKSSWIE